MGPISRGLKAQRRRLIVLQGFGNRYHQCSFLYRGTTTPFAAAPSHQLSSSASAPLFYSSGDQRRLYSSRVTTTGDDAELCGNLKESPTASTTSLDASASRSASLLVAAAQKEAERILSSKEKEDVAEEESSEAALKQTATHLLTLTIRVKLLSLALERQKDQRAMKAMQRAFILLVSACLKKKSDAAFTGTALNLTRRAHALSLPFPLPVYRELVTAIATHLKDPASLIPEVCAIPRSLLQTKFEPSFFSDPLLILVERGFVGEALELHEEILFRFNVDALSEPRLAMAISTLVKEQLLRRLKALEDGRDEDDDDDGRDWGAAAMELSNRTRRALDAFLEDAERPLRDHNKMMELIDWFERNLDDLGGSKLSDQYPNYDSEDDDGYDISDNDDDYDTSDDDDDYDTDYDEEDESQTIENSDHLTPRSFRLNDGKGDGGGGKSPTDRGNRYDDDDDDYEDDDEDDLLDAVARQHVYLRDADTFRLPDVTLQFRDLNGGKDVLYSRKFQAHLLDRLRGGGDDDDDELNRPS